MSTWPNACSFSLPSQNTARVHTNRLGLNKSKKAGFFGQQDVWWAEALAHFSISATKTWIKVLSTSHSRLRTLSRSRHLGEPHQLLSILQTSMLCFYLNHHPITNFAHEIVQTIPNLGSCYEIHETQIVAIRSRKKRCVPRSCGTGNVLC